MGGRIPQKDNQWVGVDTVIWLWILLVELLMTDVIYFLYGVCVWICSRRLYGLGVEGEGKEGGGSFPICYDVGTICIYHGVVYRCLV